MLKKVLTRIPFKNICFASKQITRPSFQLQKLAHHFCDGKARDGIDQNFKDQSKEFYENFVDNVVDLKSTADWQKIIPSTKEPIIIDLYADWCGPCKQLTPRLENRIKDMKGIKMVKVNIDKCPEIASALQVKSVPTVYLLFQGQAVDGFQGNASDAELDRFFQTIKKLTGTSSEEVDAIQALDSAKNLMNEGNIEGAIEILVQFKEKKVKQDLIALKELFLAQCYLSINKTGKFKETFVKLARHEGFIEQVPDLQKFYHIMKEEMKKMEEESKEDPQILEWKAKLSSLTAKDEVLEGKMELAVLYKSKEMVEESLVTALEVVKEDKNWKEKKANKFILETFKELGNSSPLVQTYRKIFQRLLN